MCRKITVFDYKEISLTGFPYAEIRYTMLSTLGAALSLKNLVYYDLCGGFWFIYIKNLFSAWQNWEAGLFPRHVKGGLNRWVALGEGGGGGGGISKP